MDRGYEGEMVGDVLLFHQGVVLPHGMTKVEHDFERGGEYVGEFLGMTAAHVFQAASKGGVLAHDRRYFQSPPGRFMQDADLPNIGTQISVTYHPYTARATVAVVTGADPKS